jgi:hypothetical protein
MASRADLIERVLQNLGVWQAGQDLPPEDYRVVDQNLERHLGAMAKARVYIVEDAENIPDDAMTEIANYLAHEYAGVFGIAGEELQDIRQRAALAEGALRFHRAMGPTYQPMQPDYF